MALHTDPHPAVKISQIFFQKNYEFSNICLEEKVKVAHFVFFSHNKAETKTLMNVLADLFFQLPTCLLSCWRLYELSTWQHIKTESSDVDLNHR